MSERYGPPGELQEALGDLEDWMLDEIDGAETQLRGTYGQSPQYDAGRLSAYRAVLAFIVVNA